MKMFGTSEKLIKYKVVGNKGLKTNYEIYFYESDIVHPFNLLIPKLK